MHKPVLAIRREDNPQERRCPVAPAQLPELAREGLEVVVQRSSHRIFDDDAFAAAGATVVDDLGPYPLICGIKEIALDQLEPGKTYLFFSHTIKGQPQNMPLLARLLEIGCSVVDHECIADDEGRRQVFFGRFAGLAGMLDSLWALGQRLACQGLESALATIQPAHRYADLAAALADVRRAGTALRREGLARTLRPLVVGVAGTGNTAAGAAEILDALGATPLPAEDLAQLAADDDGIYRVMFDVHHLVTRVSEDEPFDMLEYFEHPERYRLIFTPQLARLTVLMNCIYWDERYPRLATRQDLARLYGEPSPKLQVIGDISCDIEGAIEATSHATWPDNPVYVYDVRSERPIDGVEGHGPAILAVYNLPAELPRDASRAFGEQLLPFLPALARADLTRPLRAQLPPELARAVIVDKGQLTPAYAHLARFL